MEDTLATVEDTQITLPTGREVTNKNGKVMRTEFNFLPHGVKSASQLRKYFRDEKGMTNAQAREAANAAVSGQQGKVQELMAIAFIQDSIHDGFMPTGATMSAKKDKRGLLFEKKDIGAQVKDAATKQKLALDKQKAEFLANARASMEAAGMPEETIAMHMTAMSA